MTSYDLYHDLPVQAAAGHGEAAELQPGLQQEEQHRQQRRAQHRLQGGYRVLGAASDDGLVAFTFKTLLRHSAKQALTHVSRQ